MPSKAAAGRGPKGERGKRGERGERGDRGVRGARGVRGQRGPAGRPTRREDILAVVDDQFNELRDQLNVQLTRFGQVQSQLDQIHTLVKQLVKGPY